MLIFNDEHISYNVQTLSENFCDLIYQIDFKQQLIENRLGSNRLSMTATSEKIGVTTKS